MTESAEAGPSSTSGSAPAITSFGAAAAADLEPTTSKTGAALPHATTPAVLPTHPGQTQAGRTSKSIPTSATLRRRLTHIPARQPVLIRLPNDKLKSVELHPGKVVSLGKFGSFRGEDIIGLPFGLTFEIVAREGARGGAEDSSLPTSDVDVPMNDENGIEEREQAGSSKKKSRAGRQSKKTARANGASEQEVGELKVVLSSNLDELEDNQATNELFGSDPDPQVQTMTYLDLRALKDAGVEGRDIVQKQVASNATFEMKNSWSQQKFILRKEAKHMRLFTPLPPTLSAVSRYYQERYDRDTNDKLQGLRADTIANIMSMAGVAPGRRFLVVDGVGGLVAGAMLERMGGEGRVLILNDADSPPPLDLMAQMNLPTCVVDPVLRSMHWGCTEPDWQSLMEPDTSDAITPAGKPANERDRQRFKKRRAAHSDLERLRSEYFAGEYDGIIIASTQYECTSIIERVMPFLAGSASIVVHSPFLQALTEAHAQMRQWHNLVNVSIVEPFQRRYQVLPGRMHPEMMTSATGGYLLHAIYVFTEEATRAIVEGERQAQKRTSMNAQGNGAAAASDSNDSTKVVDGSNGIAKRSADDAQEAMHTPDTKRPRA